MKIILDTVAHDVEKNYYDPSMHGLDWKQLVATTRASIDKAQTPSEMLTAIFALLFQLQDSHTIFLPPGRINTPVFGFEAKVFGNGVYVYKLRKGGAAEAAGLKLGDRLLTVNGFNAVRASFDNMMLFFRALRPVASMRLEVARVKSATQFITVDAKIKTGVAVVDLTDEFNVWNLIREAEDDPDRYHYGTHDGAIGYLQLPSFMVDAESGFLHGLVKKVAKDRAFIIDLRENPGGIVTALQQFAGFFDEQPTVIAEIKGRKQETLKVRPQKSQLAGPLFILVDSQTASAAEIFARHFQRTARAVVIGDRTSGRVTAARFFPEQTGADQIVPFGVEVTIGHVLFPGAEDLEGKGVTPDDLCVPSPTQLASGADPCFAEALTLARKALGIAAQPDAKVEKKD